MKLVFKICFAFVFFETLIFCQSLEKGSSWYSADHFSGENAIESQEVIFNENEMIFIYNNFTYDTLISKQSIKKGTVLPVDDSYIEILTGMAIMVIDTVLFCMSSDDYSKDKMELIIGDTLDYYVYYGEGIHLVGKNGCTTELSNHRPRTMRILSDNTIVSHSLHIHKLNGWIKLENHNAELNTKWAKTY